MPLFSEHISNMYYSGSPYSSPYSSYSSVTPHGSYSASYLNPGGNYNTHSSLGGYTRPSPISRPSPVSSRWVTSSGRNYAPMLSTITERGSSSPVRINSPRRIPYTNRVYATPSYTPRPVNINTADIDVSRDKYRNKQEPATPAPVSATVPEPENDNGPFMPRIDGKPETGIDSSPGIQRSTIRRGRTVVRLHTVKRRDKDSPRESQSKYQDSEDTIATEQVSENAAGNVEQNETTIGWREKLSEDLTYKDKKEKKTIGARLVEKFIVKDKDSDSDGSFKEKKKKVENVAPVQVIQQTPAHPSRSAYTRSPDRRCSVELLAEQAQVLDTLIRGENLSVVNLDISQVGISDQSESQRPPSVKRRKSKNDINPLQTTRSDYSLHDNLKFRDAKNLSKRKSLKKSSSGSSICRLDSITEFPKSDLMTSDLPAIEEVRTLVKQDSVKQKPKPKLKAVIISSVEVSPPMSPLKFKVDVTVDEKPLTPKTPKKEIIYSTIVEDVQPVEQSVASPVNMQKTDKGLRKYTKKKTKTLAEEGDDKSPEPDDGNFWDKIGKRETIYLMKRKQIINETMEKNRRAFYWFDEDEETVAGNEDTSKDNSLIVNKSSEEHKTVETPKPNELIQNSEKYTIQDVESVTNKDLSLNNDNKTNTVFDDLKDNIKVDVKPDLEVKDLKKSEDLKKKAPSSGDILEKPLHINAMKEVSEPKIIETKSQSHLEGKDLKKSNDIKKKASPPKDNIEKLSQINVIKDVSETKIIESNSHEAIDANKKDTVIENKITNTKMPEIPNKDMATEVSVNENSLDENEIKSIDSKPEKPVEIVQVKQEKAAASPTANAINIQAAPKVTEQLTKDDKCETCPSCGGKVNEETKKDTNIDAVDSKNLKQDIKLVDKAKNVPQISKINKEQQCIPELNKVNNKIESKVMPPGKDLIKDKKPTESIPTQPIKDNKLSGKSSSDKTNKNSPEKKTSLPKLEKNKKAPLITTKSQDQVGEQTIVQNEEVKANNADTKKKSSKKDFASKPVSETAVTTDLKTEDKANKEIVAPKPIASKVPEVSTVIESENIPNKNNEIEMESNKPEPVQENKIVVEKKADCLPVKVVNLFVPTPSQPEVVKGPSPRRAVKEEAAAKPLIATPRPLQKKVPQVIHSSSSSESSSEEESSEDEDADESDASDGSTEFFECENQPDGRTSTGSNDSGFDSSAPTSPAGFVNIKKGGESAGTSGKVPAPGDTADLVEHELEQSTAYGLFRRTGRFTPPARSIPRFRKYNIEDFHFIKVLGKGSFGKVMLAELRDTEYYYAVKCLKKDVVLEDDDVECTLIERKVLALGTNHPYLCHLFATFQTDCHLFFVMEYLNGGDLMFHIQQSGRFPEARARFYAAEIVSGLKFLHKRGIVYRDLKLDNILLDFDGHVRIADFGMCKLQIYLDKTADTFCGTPDYMAPEIIKGQKYNQTVDWWSFGVLLYEMLIGQSPFSGCDEDELFWSICNEIPSYPRFLSTESLTILTRLLDKDMTTRLGGAECMHGDVRDQDFFHAIHWDRLERRELEAPFRPRVRHPLDTQYFDRAFTGERPRLTAVEPQVLRTMDQAPFRGFSYTNPNATDR